MTWQLSKQSQAALELAAKNFAAIVAQEAQFTLSHIEVQVSANMLREFQVRINAHKTFNTEITISGEPVVEKS